MYLEEPNIEPGAPVPMTPVRTPLPATRPAAAPAAEPLVRSQEIPVADAALLQRQSMARQRIQDATASPEALVRLKREQSLASYRKSLAVAKARVQRYGWAERSRDPEGYARVNAAYEMAQRAAEQAESVLDEQSESMLEAARRLLAGGAGAPPPAAAALQPSPAGPVIEIGPRQRPAFDMSR
jgi:hypothetical protein